MGNAALYVATALIWGTTWFAIKFQVGDVAPELSVAYRFGLASMILFAYCAVRGLRFRFDRRAHGFAALLGLLLFCLNYILYYTAVGQVTTGLVALVFSSTMLFNILFGALFLKSPVRLRVLAGGVIGVGGIGLVFWPELVGPAAAHATPLGLAIAIVATIFVSLGNIVSARNQLAGMRVVQTNAVSMAYGAGFTLLIALVRGQPLAFDWSWPYVVSLAHLSVLGSVVGFGCYLTLLGRIGADRVAYVNIVNPLIALGLSTLFEGFDWGWVAGAGLLLVLGGNVVAISYRRRPNDGR